MILLQILQIIIGLPLALFITGYLIARIWFSELEELEKVALGFVLSIAIDIFVGLFLGYNKTMKDITGGITAFNLWLYLGTITIILFIIWYIKKPEEAKKIFQNSKNKKLERAIKNIEQKKK